METSLPYLSLASPGRILLIDFQVYFKTLVIQFLKLHNFEEKI